MRYLVLLLIAVLVVAPSYAQQTGSVLSSKMSWGDPDISGVWAAEFITPLERPAGVETLVVSDEDAPALIAELRKPISDVDDPDFVLAGVDQLASVGGEMRSSVVTSPADGHIPFNEAGLAATELAFRNFLSGYDNPEDRPEGERCIGGSGAPPMRTFPLAIPLTIIQTRDHVILRMEDVGAIRVVHLSGPEPTIIHPTFEGYSNGEWDDGDLVVTTSHFRSDLARGGFGRGVFLSEDAIVVERFSRLAYGRILYAYEVTDPAHYTSTWAGEFPLKPFDARAFEYACHEGNYSMKGVLLGGRAESARLAANDKR